jgi:hypothetical protein
MDYYLQLVNKEQSKNLLWAISVRVPMLFDNPLAFFVVPTGGMA